MLATTTNVECVIYRGRCRHHFFVRSKLMKTHSLAAAVYIALIAVDALVAAAMLSSPH